MAGQARHAPPKLTAGKPLTALRILSALTVVSILAQGATAGELLTMNEHAREPHEIGAIVLHVLAGLTALVAGLLWRSTRTSCWPTVVATLVFLGSFAQGAVGHERTLFIHVPLALLLLVGAVWVLTWAALRPARDVPAW